MRYGSVCSGIEAASVAWHDLGWEPQWFSEIEQFPSEVLKYRFPHVPNLGDMTTINQNPIADERPIDLLVGGTPCQSFSVAGLRKGLADPRGNLMLTFLSIADKRRPKWIVWENVPGVLSSNGGKDFGTFLGALGELGYGFAYRVLDAQHFGVAQRRRRVFVVGYLGDWRPATAVLFESESLQRDSKPSRKKGQETPSDAQGGVRATGFAGNVESQVAACLQTTCDDYSRADGFNTVIEQVAQPIAVDWRTTQVDIEKTGTLKTDLAKMSGPCIAVDTYNYTTNDKTTQTIRSQSDTEHIGAVLEPTIIDRAAFNQGENAQYEPRIEPGQTMSSLVAKGPHAVAQPLYYESHPQDSRVNGPKDVADTVSANYGMGGGNTPLVQQPMAIRRLTPKECERLQGFPDDWTKVPYRNKEADQCPDGPRYKACGNSMAVPVMRWIGERINLIESML